MRFRDPGALKGVATMLVSADLKIYLVYTFIVLRDVHPLGSGCCAARDAQGVCLPHTVVLV